MVMVFLYNRYSRLNFTYNGFKILGIQSRIRIESRYRNVVVGGHVFEMGNRWGRGKGKGEEKGGRSLYSQPGIGVDGNCTTTQRRDSK